MHRGALRGIRWSQLVAAISPLSVQATEPTGERRLHQFLELLAYKKLPSQVKSLVLDLWLTLESVPLIVMEGYIGCAG